MPRGTTTRPLRCYACGSQTIQMDGGGNTRRQGGRTRQTQHARCLGCGHEWNATHPEARRLGRLADELGHPVTAGEAVVAPTEG